MADWLARVKLDTEVTCIALGDHERTGHLPKLLHELVHRLRVPRALGTKQVSEGAVQHGKIRHSQGYSISMMVEESRMLQVSIFHTLQTNLSRVDFSLLLIDMMTIVDEVDSQLKQTIVSFSEAAGGCSLSYCAAGSTASAGFDPKHWRTQSTTPDRFASWSEARFRSVRRWALFVPSG